MEYEIRVQMLKREEDLNPMPSLELEADWEDAEIDPIKLQLIGSDLKLFTDGSYVFFDDVLFELLDVLRAIGAEYERIDNLVGDEDEGHLQLVADFRTFVVNALSHLPPHKLTFEIDPQWTKFIKQWSRVSPQHE